MAQRAITDDLLRTAVGLRVGAGVSTAKIEKLIFRFSNPQGGEAPTGDDASGVDPGSVPQERRGELLTALADLAPEPDFSPDDAARPISAIDVWPCRIAEDAKMHRTAPAREVSDDAGGEPEPSPQPAAGDAAAPQDGEPPVAEAPFIDAAEWPQQSAAEVTPLAGEVTAPATPEVDGAAGDMDMWDRSELTRIKAEIASRREEIFAKHARELKEMLARQAEELKALDADQGEVEALEQAIAAMASKFRRLTADSPVAMAAE